MRVLAAELQKILTLPGVWIAVVVALAAPAGIVVVAARQAEAYGVGPAPDDAYAPLAILGIVGAIVIGVLAVSSEYAADDAESGGGRPISTTLVLLPNRAALLAAKLAATAIVVALLAAASTALTLVTNAVVTYGDLAALSADDVSRGAGVVIYWVLMAWMAFGITLLTRDGVIPMAALIINSSLVSVTYLLSLRVNAASFFPDLAGAAMFIRDRPTSIDFDPLTGGLVMAAWTLVIVGFGEASFRRRDA